MADSSRPKLGSHLEWHGSKIRVKVRVPPTVQRSAKLSAWLKVTLPTDSARTAETLKWPVIAKLKQQIEGARNGVVSGTHADPLLAEGLLWKDAIADDPSAGGPSDFTVVHHLYDRVDEVVSAQGEAKGDFLAGIALGIATPLDSLIDPWIAEKGYRGRTAVAHRHSLRVFGAWCVAEKVAVTIEAVTRKVAGRFVTKTFIEPGIHPATANKALSALSSYWVWLLKRGHRDEAVNPWQGQFIKAGSRPKGEDGQGMKRPFTDTEARTLLDGITRQPLADMCLLAALSGCRITELAELKVRHVTLTTEDKPCISAFRIVQGKTESAARHVPIHSDALAMLQRRCEGKRSDGYVFHELPTQTNEARKRSSPMSQFFTRERRRLEVDDVLEGVRQSRIDFHSWRRWFIRQAIEALEKGATGFTAWTISDVVGHEKEEGPLGMTMGRYPGTAGLEALKACIEAVKLPPPEKLKAAA